MKSLISKLLGFATPIVVNAVVSLMTIPALVAVLGPDAWGRVAVAQSAGALGSVVVGFGWAVVGPASVAALPRNARGDYFGRSIPPRLILFSVTIPALILLTLLVARPTSNAAWLSEILIAVGMAAAGLSSSWFFVAEAAPWRLVLWDLLPRAAGTLAAVGVLLATRSLLLFAVLFLLGYLAAAVSGTWSVLRRHPTQVKPPSMRELAATLRTSLPAFTTAATSALYVNVPLLLLSALNPAALATYALADKIYRFSLTAVQPINQIAQGYVPAGRESERPNRINVAATGTAVAALTFGLLFVVFGPWLGEVLSRGEIEVPRVIFALLAAAGLCVVLSRFTGLTYLVLVERTRTLARSTVLGAVTGIFLTVILAPSLGGTGVAAAILGAEIFVLIVQLIVILNIRRSRSA